MWMISALLRPKLLSWMAWVFLVFIISAGVACSATRQPPPIKNYPAPSLTVQPIPYDEAGCSQNEFGNIVCPADSVMGSLGCDELDAAGDYLGGLSPAYPINLCWKIGMGGERLSQDEYLYRTGCLLPRYARYVIQRDGNYQLVDSSDKLRETFAPITSADEALSYAIAATGLSAYFGFEPSPGFRYFVDQLEDTHVTQTGEGYLVYLYDYKLCGCGPHTSSYVEVLIKSDGTVQELNRIPVFEDPEQDQLCID